MPAKDDDEELTPERIRDRGDAEDAMSSVTITDKDGNVLHIGKDLIVEDFSNVPEIKVSDGVIAGIATGERYEEVARRAGLWKGD